MRPILSIAAAALLLLWTGADLRAQDQEQSDYDITQAFGQKYDDLMKAITQAQTVQDCGSISSNIDDLEKQYSQYKALLDKALYPDNFDKKIMMVRGQLAYAQNKLGLIQESVARIAELESQVKVLSDKVDRLTSENTSLVQEIEGLRSSHAQDQKSLDSLRGLVAKLRENIRQRDQMIFSLVDSIFMQYDKNVEAMKDIEKQSLTSHLERNNVLSNVKRAIGDNVAFLQSTSLSGHDVAALAGEEQKFEAKWRSIGPKLASIYLSKREQKRELATIDTMLADWSRRADAAMWRALNELFTSHNLTVKPFSNAEQFHGNVLSFINDELQNANQQTEAARFDTYTTFADTIWTNEIEKVWQPVLLENNVMTAAQFDEIKSKLADWHSQVQPPRTWLYVVIVVVILAIALFIYRRSRKPSTGAPA